MQAKKPRPRISERTLRTKQSEEAVAFLAREFDEVPKTESAPELTYERGFFTVRIVTYAAATQI